MRYLAGVTTLRLDPGRCTGCGRCADVCPHEVFRMVDRAALIADRDACMECGACARNCASGALSVQAGVGCAAAMISAATGKKGGCACEAPATCGPKPGPPRDCARPGARSPGP